MTHYTNTQLHT